MTTGQPGQGPLLDDEASADEQGDVGLDLSPRTADRAVSRVGGASRTRWPWLVVVAVLVVGIGFVISRAITDATQYYLTADEAVARRDELGAREFRLEGTVVEGTPRATPDGVEFRIASRGVEVEVRNVGAPPPLFQPCIPVVVAGHWQEGRFASTEIIVAHDEQYEEQNSQRMQEAIAAGAESNACAQRDAVAKR